METLVAFLRAINVGGRAVVKMAELQQLFAAAGCREVRTVLQSGNVLFAAAAGLDGLRAGIQDRLAERLGGDALAIFRTVSELRALAQADPFRGAAAGPDTKLYVALLARPPAGGPAGTTASPRDGLEILGRAGLDVFLVSRRLASGRFGFPNNFVEKELAVPATTRNWNTIERIVALAGA